MIHPQRLAHPIIVVLLLCSVHAHAQTPAQTSEATKELRENAFALLESAAGQVSSLQSAENRARIAANIMESIWTHDEKLARSLLVLIESDIREALNSEDPENPRDHRFQVFLKLRSDTMDRIAKHDPELALEFLKTTDVTAAQRLPNRIFLHNRYLELRLAQKIAANKPDVALKIARESLAHGFSDNVLRVLRQLSKKHKNEARTLYKEIVEKLKTVNLQDDWQNRNLVQLLALSYTPPDADAATFQEFISYLVTKALDGGCRQRNAEDYQLLAFCVAIVSSLPPSYRSDARVGELSHWANREHGSNPGQYELNVIAQDGSVDEILELREKYPSLEPSISWRAFGRALESGDVLKAREVAKSSANSEAQKSMLERLDGRNEKARASNDELIADLQRRLNEQPGVEERFRLLLSVADQVAATDRNSALKLVAQASDIADTFQPQWQQARAQIFIALMYCQSKSDRCFQIMESLLPRLNQLVDAAAKLDGFDTHYLRDGEWNMSANGRIGELLTWLANHAAYFAWSDFDRAVSLSNQFERTEIRLMAQVKLAQSILAGPPASLFARYGQYYRR